MLPAAKPPSAALGLGLLLGSILSASSTAVAYACANPVGHLVRGAGTGAAGSEQKARLPRFGLATPAILIQTDLW